MINVLINKNHKEFGKIPGGWNLVILARCNTENYYISFCTEKSKQSRARYMINTVS